MSILGEGITVIEEEIVRDCGDKLPDSHLPWYMKFFRNFPVTPLGKAQKPKMHEMSIKKWRLE
ncbi:hypothetical protein AM501_11515 [Aneurinibacillus migulanus]|uniref:AMP-binding enzyme C-terminal domain-containing protein n=1 Tax=Aneurinibacillus migulanus TaxID=47500 RepID=A0A0D1UUU1_ANEMI|nr:hypothetical protein TS65_28590 [Aneurinibacillus migulanus]KIV58515.1 hypothetical protein TS64_04625 [Aneurinibacillus migulanus]KON97103.1 hypothetical protein AF333_18155 [Aneurinibacillus migulanus]KPD08172.1 hypothetical protein AM501_11515 [Aneurinibacillus migulanus]GED18129.1 hypothetical protein AMI01nite_61200 [Aneurinibacillus migulanus]